MTKLITTCVAMILSGYGFAQNIMPPSGNVGIGTSEPTDLLHIYSNNQKGEIRIGGANGPGNGRIFIQADFANNTSYIDAYGDNSFKRLSIEAAPLILNGSSNANVGIGTSNPSPIGGFASTLGINSRSHMYSGGVSYMADGVVKGYTYFDNGAMAVQGASGVPIKFMTNNLEVVRLTTEGKLGIGTASPEHTLDVNGDGQIASSIITNSNSPFSNTSILYSRAGFNNMFGVDGTWTTRYFGLKTDGNFITMGGNVGIGTTTPDSKLTVAGKIHSQEVKVTVDAGADFVFQKDYPLKSLAAVSEYVRKNKHLPEIPSSDEMKRDGLNLGEMNIKLLQKIEELTLYMIELKKQVDVVDSENRTLKGRVAQLEGKNNK